MSSDAWYSDSINFFSLWYGVWYRGTNQLPMSSWRRNCVSLYHQISGVFSLNFKLNKRVKQTFFSIINDIFHNVSTYDSDDDQKLYTVSEILDFINYIRNYYITPFHKFNFTKMQPNNVTGNVTLAWWYIIDCTH